MSAIVGSQSVQIDRAAAVEPQAVAGGRVLGIDIWRAIAALCIVWVHVLPLNHFEQRGGGFVNLFGAGLWGTAFLNLLAGYFVVIGLNKALETGRGAPRFLWHRVVRIGGAFVLWSLIYAAARLLYGGLRGGTVGTMFSTTQLFIGTEYHLWFLPYLITMTLLTAPIILVGLRGREWSMWLGAGFVAVSVAIIAMAQAPMNPETTSLAVFLEKVFVRSPGFMLGVAFGLWSLHGRFVQPGWGTVLVCIGVLITSIVLSMTTDLPRPVLDRVAAVSAFIASQAPWRGRIARWVASLGALGFGVYLCHVLFVKAAGSALGALGIHESLLLNNVLAAVTAATASFAFVWWVKRTPLLNRLMP